MGLFDKFFNKVKTTTDYYESGQKMSERHWKDGKKEGLWTFWDTEGNVTKTETFKDGELVKWNSFP